MKLRSVELITRPISSWTEFRGGGRLHAPFRATWTTTLDLLDRELHALGVGPAVPAVLEVDVTPGQLRRDGFLRADARPASPAVRLAFDSRHGPLVYATDRFDRWQDNVRAIALALEALRKVDRYAVGGHGEQYRGWTAIPEAPAVEDPLDVLAVTAGVTRAYVEVVAHHRDPGPMAKVLRVARRRAHPDTGGTAEQWNRVQAAAAALGLT